MAGFLLRCPPDLRERPGNGPELLPPGVRLAALLSGRSELQASQTKTKTQCYVARQNEWSTTKTI